LLLGAVLVSAPLFAEEPAKKPWTSKTELSVVSANGNSKATTSSAKEAFTYEVNKTKTELEAAGLGAKSQGVVTAEEYFASEKVAYSFTEKNYVYEKFRWDKNRFAGIEDRYDSSVGLG